MKEGIKELSDLIAVKAPKEASCFPIDRYFIEPYLKEIVSFDKIDFIVYNLERVNNGYSVSLFLCLPELWEDITFEEVKGIINRLTNEFSFYALIMFFYKYLEINLIALILEMNSIPLSIKNKIKQYLKSQYPNLIKQEGELFVLDEDIIGVKNDSLMYIKQMLLLDNRFIPAYKSLEDVKKYIDIVVV